MTEGKHTRHEHRIIALQLLYMVDVRNGFNLKNIKKEIEKINKNKDAIFIGNHSGYYYNLVNGVIKNFNIFDKEIDELAIDWDIDRINILDKNILRIALYEIQSEIPVGVAINEAVQIAKEFNNKKSAKFINGILGEKTRRE